MWRIPQISVFVAFLLIYGPRLLVLKAQASMPEGFNNRTPREQQAKLTGFGARANGAHQNSFEAFAPFAAGVILCLITGNHLHWVSPICIAFVVARIAYIACYLLDVAPVRSGVWTLGFLCSLSLLGIAAFG